MYCKLFNYKKEVQLMNRFENGFINLNKLRNALTYDEVELTTESVEQVVVTLTAVYNGGLVR